MKDQVCVINLSSVSNLILQIQKYSISFKTRLVLFLDVYY